VLPDFSFRDLVVIQMKYLEDGAERRLVVCSAYLPYDSKDPPPSREMEKFVRHCEKENLRLIVGCDSNAHHTAWGSTNWCPKSPPYRITDTFCSLYRAPDQESQGHQLELLSGGPEG